MYYGEKLNSITHLVGTVLSLMGLGALLTVAAQTRDLWVIISFSLFGVTAVLLYAMSTLYHSFSTPRVKYVFKLLDHVSIYLLIAGTYTPFTLVLMRDGNGFLILAIVWALAAVGILMDILPRKRNTIVQLIIYLLMGWAITFDMGSLREALPDTGYHLLLAGGVSYSAGVVFYVLDKLDKMAHAHGIWHFFVMVGTVCHFISIIGYVR